MDSARSSLTPIDGWDGGPIPPRLVTPTLGGEDYADRIARFARDHLDTELWDWQLAILAGVTQHQDDGFNHRWSLYSTARQNGKSKLIAALIGWWLTEGRLVREGPQQVLSVAHKLDTAEQIAYELFPTLEQAYGFDVWQSSGRMIARHDDGSIWRIQSATPKAGHGTTNDLLVVDELFDVDELVLNSGLLPTQRARPNPLAVFCSTAGTDKSVAFRRWRDRGLKIINDGKPDRLFFAEWSPPPGSDPGDRRVWHLGNPALGCGHLTMQDLEDEWRAPDRDAFIRSGLNMWIAAHLSWIPHGVWDTLATDDPMPDGGFLAVDSDLGEAGYVGVRAALRPDGTIQVAHELSVDRLADLWPAVAGIHARGRPVIALTPGLASVCPPPLNQSTVTVGRIEMQRFTQLVRNTVLERTLVHGGQAMLSEQVNRAVPVSASGALTLSSSRSPGPIELARCMVWAVGLALKPSTRGKPEFGRAR
jgi:hypothetical protein